MADPLSVAASIISIVGAVHVTIKGLERIRKIKDAPDLIMQLSSEISEIGLLMHIAKTAASNNHCTLEAEIASGLISMIERAHSSLNTIRRFLRNQIVKDPRSLDDETRKIEIKWNIWLLKEGRVRELIERLTKIKQDIASALAAITTISTMELPRFQVSIQQAAAVSENLTSTIIRLESSMVANFESLRIRNVQEESNTIESSVQATPGHSNIAHEVKATPRQNEFAVDLTKNALQRRTVQSTPCNCNCHAPTAVRTPQWLRSIFGSLLISYSLTSAEPCRPCSRNSCKVENSSLFQSRYYFPPWMLHRMLSMQCKWDPLGGCSYALKTPRAVSSRSTVFTLAQHGNIKGMQRLFEQRLASPYDISIEEGRSALHFAVTAQQSEMVAFLLENGSDPQLEDHNTLSAQDIVWNYLLQMPGSPAMEALLCAAGLSMSDTDSLEKRNFSALHRIVLGFSNVDLESYLETSTSELDLRDSLGKTPLCWAASRPDADIVATLLRFGASPSLGDNRLQTPLHYCAGSGTSEATEMVLKAALEEAKLRARKWKRQSITDNSEPSPDFLSAIVDARDIKGRTPLNFATRMNFPTHAELLISYGANIEAVDSVLDRTMLLSAIYWRSHQVLPVLLGGGARTDVLDARKASLVHYAAKFGDLTALHILTKFEIGPLDADAVDDAGSTAWAIFESRHERCINEDDAMRAQSMQAFQKLIDHAKGVGLNVPHFPDSWP